MHLSCRMILKKEFSRTNKRTQVFRDVFLLTAERKAALLLGFVKLRSLDYPEQAF